MERRGRHAEGQKKDGEALETCEALELMAACMTRNMKGLTPRLTGAGARSAEGTNTGHENGEAMASVGVRVEPTVRTQRLGPRLCVVRRSLSVSWLFLRN